MTKLLLILMGIFISTLMFSMVGVGIAIWIKSFMLGWIFASLGLLSVIGMLTSASILVCEVEIEL